MATIYAFRSRAIDRATFVDNAGSASRRDLRFSRTERDAAFLNGPADGANFTALLEDDAERPPRFMHLMLPPLC